MTFHLVFQRGSPTKPKDWLVSEPTVPQPSDPTALELVFPWMLGTQAHVLVFAQLTLNRVLSLVHILLQPVW